MLGNIFLSAVTYPVHSAKPTTASAEPSTTGRSAPQRSRMRPPIRAVTTKPMRRTRETGRTGALEVLAGEEEPRDEHQHGDPEGQVLDQGRPDATDVDLGER